MLSNQHLPSMSNKPQAAYEWEENLNKIWADHLQESMESCIAIYWALPHFHINYDIIWGIKQIILFTQLSKITKEAHEDA